LVYLFSTRYPDILTLKSCAGVAMIAAAAAAAVAAAVMVE
jgi:hypothetical protein